MSKVQNFPITIDGDFTTLQQLLADNSGDDVTPLEESDISAIISLQPGQSHYIPVHAGWTKIKRPVELELTNYEQWQLESHGDILPSLTVTPEGECENSEEEINRYAEWANMMAESQLLQHQ